MSILGHFGHFWANLGRMKFFPKSPVLSLFKVYEPLTSCNILEKTNEVIPKKVRY